MRKLKLDFSCMLLGLRHGNCAYVCLSAAEMSLYSMCESERAVSFSLPLVFHQIHHHATMAFCHLLSNIADR